MLVAQSFSTLFGVFSGPFVFFGLTLLSSFFTPSSVISKWLMSGDGLPFNYGLFVIFPSVITDTNCWFSATASFLQSSIIFPFELSIAIPHESLFFDLFIAKTFFQRQVFFFLQLHLLPIMVIYRFDVIHSVLVFISLNSSQHP